MIVEGRVYLIVEEQVQTLNRRRASLYMQLLRGESIYTTVEGRVYLTVDEQVQTFDRQGESLYILLSKGESINMIVETRPLKGYNPYSTSERV